MLCVFVCVCVCVCVCCEVWESLWQEDLNSYRQIILLKIQTAESNMETYIAICKIDSQWEFAIWLRELKQGLCNNLEG